MPRGDSDDVALGCRRNRGLVTERNLEALLSAAEGETMQETAERLGITVQAVAKRRQAACQELGARNITHAVALACQRGIFHKK